MWLEPTSYAYDDYAYYVCLLTTIVINSNNGRTRDKYLNIYLFEVFKVSQ